MDALLLLAVVAFAAWLLARPPRDVRDATVRLIVLYAVLFTLAPSTRYGYYAYPLALVGWLVLTRGPLGEAPVDGGGALAAGGAGWPGWTGGCRKIRCARTLGSVRGLDARVLAEPGARFRASRPHKMATRGVPAWQERRSPAR